MSVLYTVLAVLALRRAHRRHRGVRRRRVLADRAGAQHGRRECPHRRAPRPARAAGAPHPVVPALGRPGGHLDHHVDHRLSRRAAGGASAGAGLRRDRRCPPDVAERPGVGAGAVDRDVGVDGVRRTRRPVPRRGQAAADCACGGRPAGAVLDAGHPVDPPDQRHRQLDPAPAGHRARRGTAVGPLTAGARLAGAQLGPAGVAGSRHRDAGGPLAAVRLAHRRGADDAPDRNRDARGRRHRRRSGGRGDPERLLAIPDRRGRPRRDHRDRPRQTGLRSAAGANTRRPGWPASRSPSPGCRRPWTATT